MGNIWVVVSDENIKEFASGRSDSDPTYHSTLTVAEKSTVKKQIQKIKVFRLVLVTATATTLQQSNHQDQRQPQNRKLTTELT